VAPGSVGAQRLLPAGRAANQQGGVLETQKGGYWSCQVVLETSIRISSTRTQPFSNAFSLTLGLVT
jgi:hypothetical protein